jgi:hypothetical protein
MKTYGGSVSIAPFLISALCGDNAYVRASLHNFCSDILQKRLFYADDSWANKLNILHMWQMLSAFWRDLVPPSSFDPED